MLVAMILAAGTPAAGSSGWQKVDVATGARSTVPVAPALSATAGSIGSSGGKPLPMLSRMEAAVGFTPIARVRDVQDPTLWPARAVAKLFRLNAAGARTDNACTAQFVGPRHLVTAAHCVIDRTTGQPFAGWDIAASFDNGRANGGTARVVAAWATASAFEPATPASSLVTPDRCDDVAVVEIATPLGRATGWLGMRAAVDPGDLRRFSYPNQSAASTLTAVRDRPGTSPVVRAALDAEIARVRASEPSFSPADLYLDHGRPTRIEESFVGEPSAQSIPGRSGSAMLGQDDAMVALMSRSYGGMTYSCRLDAKTIGAIDAIVASGGAQVRVPKKA